MRWPLRLQILAPTISVMLLAFIAVAAAQVWYAVSSVEHSIQRRLASAAKTLDSTNIPLSDPILAQVAGLTGAQFAIASESGERLARSNDSIELIDSNATIYQPDTFELSSHRKYLGDQYFGSVVRMERGAAAAEPVLLHVFYPVAAWRNARWQAAAPTLVIGAIALLCQILLVFIIARQVALPLQTLTAKVHEIAGGKYAPMNALSRNDEIRDLAEAVNQMASKLSEYQQQIRKSERLRTLGQLGGGVAHHLRNAATGCKLALDFHRHECPLPDEENFRVATEQLNVMEDYLKRFLSIGNASSDSLVQRVNVVDSIQEVVDLAQPIAAHDKVQLLWKPPAATLFTMCDQQQLTQSLTNIVNNAIEAAASASDKSDRVVRVEIESSESEKKIRIVVTDTGDGPPTDSDIYEPLVSHKADGAGLGLAVAKTFAQKCNGEISHERKNDHTIFTLQLPAVDS